MFLITKRSCIVLLTMVLYGGPAIAQITIAGTVRDAVSDRLLGEVTVQVVGEYQVTVTNEEGRFQITVPTLPISVKISRIGYTSHVLLIDIDGNTVQNIMLVPAVFDLDPVIVTEHESVEDIMRRVIDRKLSWRKRLKAVRAEAYSRFSMANDTSIVFLLESLADASWDQENGWKAVVKSYRRSSNVFTDDDMDDLETLDEMSADALILNLYDDDIELVEHRLMGVTNPDALKHYRFQMAGQRLLDDRVVYDISVKPRSRLFSGFEGTISILDREFAMIEATLKPGKAFFFPPPVQNLQMTAVQQFAGFGEGFWLPAGTRITGDLKVGVVGFSVPNIRVEMQARLSEYEVVAAAVEATVDTLEIPEPVAPPEVRVVETSLNDSLLVDYRRIVPLTELETAAYEARDTTLTFFNAFEPTGFIAGIMKKRGLLDEDRERSDDGTVRDVSLSGKRVGTEASDGAIVDLDLAPEFRFNRVDGAHLGIKTTSEIRGTPVTLRSTAGYNTGSKLWFYGGGFELGFGKWKRHRISADYARGSVSRYESLAYNPTLTTLPTLFGSPDYFDYFQNIRWSLGYRYRVRGRRRIRLSGHANMESHRQLTKQTDYSFFGLGRIQRPNPLVPVGEMRSVRVRFALGEEPTPFSPERYRHVSIATEMSSPGLFSSDFDFSRTDIRLAARFDTFFKRRLFPNTIDVRLSAGFTTGVPPIQRFGILDGALFGASQNGIFRSLPGRPYEGEHYAGLFWDHNFRTIPFELLGIDPLVRRAIGLSVFGGHGRTWISPARLAGLNYIPGYQNRMHHELGLAVTGLMYLFRIDMTARLDNPGFFVNIGIGPAIME